jgi:hypothetical protein
MARGWLCVPNMEEPIAETQHAVQVTPELVVGCPWRAKGGARPPEGVQAGHHQNAGIGEGDFHVTRMELDKGGLTAGRLCLAGVPGPYEAWTGEGGSPEKLSGHQRGPEATCTGFLGFHVVLVAMVLKRGVG